MDPRIGKADYGERYRKLYQTELSENKPNHESNTTTTKHVHHTSADANLHKTNHANEHNGDKKHRNYRLVSDPALENGAKKVYSINGVIPGVNKVVVVKDPRHQSSKFYFKKEPTDLPVPTFRHDQHSVSTVLPKEVTFLNLNNNVDETFLTNLCLPFGSIDNVTIYFHPSSKKHLGIGSVLFTSTKSAKLCCEKLHNTSSMGNIMKIFVDIAGEERKKAIEETTAPKVTKTPTINTAPSFKSPSQNKLQKTSSQGSISEFTNVQTKFESAIVQNPSYSDISATLPQNGLTNTDLPTPSYSEGYFSCRQSDASEQVLSSGGESVGSGNSSLILPADPRLSRSKDNHRLVNDSPFGSDELHLNSLNFNNLNSPFTPDQSKPPKHDHTSLSNIPSVRNNAPKVQFSSPLPSLEGEMDPMQHRDPRRTKTKDFCVKPELEKAVLPKTVSSHNLVDFGLMNANSCQENLITSNEGDAHIDCELMNDDSEDKQEIPSLSLESRIEAMLNMETSFGLPRNLSFSMAPMLDKTFEQSDAAQSNEDQKNEDDQKTNGANDDDDDDRMSMSSCDEQNNDVIEVNVPAKNPQDDKPPPPPVVHQWPPMFPFQFQVGIPAYMPPFLPAFPRFYTPYDLPDVPSTTQEDESTSKFRKALCSVVKELKVVLSKDLRRKMVETSAFEVFDEWWSKNDLLDKKCGSGLFSQKLSNAGNQSSGQPNDSMLNFLFEGQDTQNRMEGFGSGGLLGLRGIAAKLPSFRKKYRAPTPPQEETGDNESLRITCASDSESEDESKDNLDVSEDAEERGSVVKFQSGSDGESSDSDDSDVDDDDEEEEDVRVGKRSKRSRLIFSDSDDDSGSESGGTAMASDESEDEDANKLESDYEESKYSPPRDRVKADREIYKKEKLKRKHSSVESSSEEDDDEFTRFTKKQKRDISEDRDIDITDETFEADYMLDNRKRKRQREEILPYEKPSKLKKLEKEEPSESTPEVPTSENHTSCRLFFPSQTSSGPSHPKMFKAESQPQTPSKGIRLTDVTNKISVDSRSPWKTSRELQNLHCSFSSSRQPFKSDAIFQSRDYETEAKIVHSFLSDGIDAEDIAYLKESYEQLILADYPQTNWLNETHWFDHPPTYIPPTPPARSRKKRSMDELASKHKTGSARTEGYYKISLQEKTEYLMEALGVQNHRLVSNPCEADSNHAAIVGMKKKVQQQSRDARSESRRLQSVFSSMGEDLGDLLKFNQLKFRKKQLKFAKSGIHDWGLFALERIQEGEMVIEYVGQVIRASIADIREKRYESIGIGSSYFFKVHGEETIVDATKYGNLARFINHSCTPNCYARVITVESQKKIVIYSRRDIEANEEITYDYKFPVEEKKIKCLCGSQGCKGTLN